jgi:hypothetical protein
LCGGGGGGGGGGGTGTMASFLLSPLPFLGLSFGHYFCHRYIQWRLDLHVKKHARQEA